MKKKILLLIILSIFIITLPGADKPFGLVIHGGAGNVSKDTVKPERAEACRAKLKEALDAGYAILKNNGTSLEAVEKVINILEDSPLFNAGKGAVFTHDGTNELDASIMDGKTLNAGAVAGVKRIKNPISLARLVMEKSVHVMMAREGAERFAKAHGMDWVPEKYFYTERRWKSLQKAKERAKKKAKPEPSKKMGTVGCAALDKMGNLAAGTSTGGMTNKKFGRVGDSPIIGAGTYANNNTCAVSATGHGEFFIRWTVAHDISALMEYKGLSLNEAADRVVMEKLVKAGGRGGIIAMDKDGNVAMPFNTTGMFRGYVKQDGKPVVKIFKD